MKLLIPTLERLLSQNKTSYLKPSSLSEKCSAFSIRAQGEFIPYPFLFPFHPFIYPSGISFFFHLSILLERLLQEYTFFSLSPKLERQLLRVLQEYICFYITLSISLSTINICNVRLVLAGTSTRISVYRICSGPRRN